MAVEITETPRHTLTVNEQNWSLALVQGPAGPAGPAGAAGPNSVTSATTSDGTADINFNQVGIGTTSPDNKLEVVGPYSATPFKVLRHGNYGNVMQIGRNGVSETANIGYPADSTINLSTAGSERLRIDSSGNVGIGTTSPDSLLELSSGSVTDFLKLTSTGGGATPIKLIFEKGPSEQGIIEFNRNGDLELYNTDADGGVMIDGSASAGGDFYVANSGNVGIGTSSPSQKLEVDGAVKKAVFTVNTLPTATAGTSCYVSDSNHTHHSNIGQVVASGGSNFVPVYYDGTDWRIG